MTATTAGQHDAEVSQGVEIGFRTAPGVDAIQQMAHGGGTGLARWTLAAGGVGEETYIFGYAFDDAGAFRNDDHRTRAQAAAARPHRFEIQRYVEINGGQQVARWPTGKHCLERF